MAILNFMKLNIERARFFERALTPRILIIFKTRTQEKYPAFDSLYFSSNVRELIIIT